MPGIEWEVKWWKREKESGVKKVNKKVGKGKKGRKKKVKEGEWRRWEQTSGTLPKEQQQKKG